MFESLASVLGGYASVFIAGLLSSFLPIPFPSPTFFLAVAAGRVLDPFFVGIAGGLGSAIGECVGYGVGKATNIYALREKYGRQIRGLERKFKKYHGSIIIFFFAATPLPFDFVGVFAGSIGYPFKKFFAANMLGKFVKYWILAYAGFYGITWITQWFALA